jgi:hypothetical protein
MCQRRNYPFSNLKILKVGSLPKDTADIETGMAPWDQANGQQNLGLVSRNRKKSSQIINAYLYLPFFLLIILCFTSSQYFKIRWYQWKQWKVWKAGK